MIKRWIYKRLWGWFRFDVLITDKQGRSIIAGQFEPWEIPITFTIPGRHVYRLKAIVITRSKRRVKHEAETAQDR